MVSGRCFNMTESTTSQERVKLGEFPNSQLLEAGMKKGKPLLESGEDAETIKAQEGTTEESPPSTALSDFLSLGERGKHTLKPTAFTRQECDLAQEAAKL